MTTLRWSFLLVSILGFLDPIASPFPVHAATGDVTGFQEIGDLRGGFTGLLDVDDFFGVSMSGIGDLDGDGIGELAVGALFDDDGGTDRGAVWVLFLNADGTVRREQKISSTRGGFTGQLDDGDEFGIGVNALGDLDLDGVPDLIVGALFDGDQGVGRGAVWLLFLNPDGSVKDHRKINDAAGGFNGVLDDFDSFGNDVTSLGDLDGDGIVDIAVGAHLDDDGDTDRGAVWILFLNSDGTVKRHQKISSTEGLFTGPLARSDFFGVSVDALGDLDRDGVVDLAVGAHGDDDHGAVWILFLRPDGTVRDAAKISSAAGGFTGDIDAGDVFSEAVRGLGDVDGDGVPDLVVGAHGDDDGLGNDTGAAWILFLRRDGSVREHRKISAVSGSFFGDIDQSDEFGSGLASLGDVDGDGVPDLAVGAQRHDENALASGAVYVLFPEGATTPRVDANFTAFPAEENVPVTVRFRDLSSTRATAITSYAWDFDGDGLVDSTEANPTHVYTEPGLFTVTLTVSDGQLTDTLTRTDFMTTRAPTPGVVDSFQEISRRRGNFLGQLDVGEDFGVSLTELGDLDGDGINEVAVGVQFDNDGGSRRGAVWILFLNPDGTVRREQKISSTQGGFTGRIDDDDQFGVGVNALGDFNGDGVPDLLVGARRDDDGGRDHGAVWLLFLSPDGIVQGHRKISDTAGGFSGALDDFDLFGNDVTSLGDLDGDGVIDIAVGAVFDDDGDIDRGAVWILFLRSDGTVKRHQKISSTQGLFPGALERSDFFGVSVDDLGDLDGDGVVDLVAGAQGTKDGGTDRRGAVWILFLRSDGTVRDATKISDTQGNFDGVLDDIDIFGEAVRALNDLDGDGIVDLVVGAQLDDDGPGDDTGAVWLLFLNRDGSVRDHSKISAESGEFLGEIDAGDRFGSGVASVDDVNGDGVPDLAIGAKRHDAGDNLNRGAVFVLFMGGDGSASDPVPPAVLDFTVDYAADTITASGTAELDEPGRFTVTARDEFTGNLLAEQTVDTAATAPFAATFSLPLDSLGLPQIIRVETLAGDLAGNATIGPALLLDTSVSTASGRGSVTDPNTGVTILIEGELVDLTAGAESGRPVVDFTSTTTVEVVFRLTEEEALSLCGVDLDCVVFAGGEIIETTVVVLGDGTLEFRAPAAAGTHRCILIFDTRIGGSGVDRATDPSTGTLVEVSGDVVQTLVAEEVATVTAGPVGGTVTVSFTLSAGARRRPLCRCAGRLRDSREPRHRAADHPRGPRRRPGALFDDGGPRARRDQPLLPEAERHRAGGGGGDHALDPDRPRR